MSLPFAPWSKREWFPRRKHNPPRQDIPWNQVVKDTGTQLGSGKGYARYLRNLPVSLMEIEMGCLDSGQELPVAGHVRRFFKEMPYVVGASNGEETRYVYVEWGSSGNVHGRPITRKELEQKGLAP